MRRPFIAGNWKMNSTRADSIELAKAVAAGAKTDSCDVAICPPSVYLDAVVQATASDSAVALRTWGLVMTKLLGDRASTNWRV